MSRFEPSRATSRYDVGFTAGLPGAFEVSLLKSGTITSPPPLKGDCMQRSSRVLSHLALAFLAALLSVGALSAEPTQRYLIQCSANCSAIATAVQQIPGASINYQFQNVTGLVATL